MDSKRFDQLSKSIANRSTRRSALTRLGLGGLFGAAAGGGIAQQAFAADGTDACVLQFHAKTAVGTNKNKIYEGDLTLLIGSDGAIDDGTFDDGGDDKPTVEGNAIGRAISFRFDFPNGDHVAFEGTAALDFTLCRGLVAGTFGGPAENDLGTWSATAGAVADSSAGTPDNSTSGNSSSNGSGSAETPAASSGNGSDNCPSQLQLCDGSTPCCTAFDPYEATNVSCTGGTCRCMYSCAQAGCGSNAATTFMTIACDQNPNDLCASMGCNA